MTQLAPPSEPHIVTAPRGNTRRAYIAAIAVFLTGLGFSCYASFVAVLAALNDLSSSAANWYDNHIGLMAALPLAGGLLVAGALTLWPSPDQRRKLAVTMRIPAASLHVLASAALVAWFINSPMPTDSMLAHDTIIAVVTAYLGGALALRWNLSFRETGLRPAINRPESAEVFTWSWMGLAVGAALFEVLTTDLSPVMISDQISGGGSPLWYTTVDSLANAVAEEVGCVVLVCLALERAGRRHWEILLTAGVMRTLMHAYYGWGALGALAFGVTNTHLFLTRRRLLPLIIAHTAIDTLAFAGVSVGQRFVLGLGGGLIIWAITWALFRPATNLPNES
jgi:hypothetical protein